MTHATARVSSEPVGEFTTIDGEDAYRIAAVDRMPSFFMSIPSDTDLWMFVTSRGGLTAGRVDPDGAIFPYETVDRLEDGHHHTGPITLLRARRGRRAEEAWEPLSDRSSEDPRLERNLYKNVTGNAVTFEEVHQGLGLAFRYRWSAADAFGLVRTATLWNHGEGVVEIDLLDGLRNLLPSGASLAMYQQSSSLVDAYKRSDCDAETRLATFSLTAQIVDRAEAAESLRANTVWCNGLPGFHVALDGGAIGQFRSGESVEGARVAKGVRGNYFVTGSLRLAPGDSVRWRLLADAGRSHVQVAAIRDRIRRSASLGGEIDRALEDATQNLRRIVAAADGLQSTADHTASVHHFSNVLYNNLRGGVFADGYEVTSADFREFLDTRNRPTAAHHAAFLADLPGTLSAQSLVANAESTEDPDLHRLALEYLPLYFGRRHGDPSRPWNRFAIHVRNEDGSRALHYEGNWRDIFQNWEALAASFPCFYPNLVAKFVNASTVDGFNSYRITRDGVDWELEDPDDPWSYIGYWGDHQIIYLLKLLEALTLHSPGSLEELLNREIFCYADVPYRIVPYREILQDPHSTIRFDTARAAEVDRRVEETGTDGRLLPGPDGTVLHVTLLEKLLVPALSKLSNLVPGGGIWMNTQRPEWNDANNALAGNGLSVVTMCYLRRYLAFLETLLDGDAESTTMVSAEVVGWFQTLHDSLTSHREKSADPASRKRWMDAVGEAFSDYRATVYARGFSGTAPLERAAIKEFCHQAREMLDLEIAAQRRDDGLYHAYNVLVLDDGSPSVNPLYEMLEGQVAALSSGAVNAEEAIRLTEAMFAGPLYREDQRTFLLYPERTLPSFLAKNVVADALVRDVPLLTELLAAGDTSVVARDVDGVVRFHADFANARDVDVALDRLAEVERWGEHVAANRASVLRVWEEVFRHRSFTGRSGTMYGYEGLGCIYWHMVAKLLLALQELVFRADRDGEPASTRSALADLYYRVRAGLGFQKTPAEYGAFPTDAYSHTPPQAGARQPGMTGQVKEEILTRLGELGVRVRGGAVRFNPILLRSAEFFSESSTFSFELEHDGTGSVQVPPHGLAFTFCGVPVVYERGGAARIRVTRRDGSALDVKGDALPAESARSLFERSGEIQRIDVEIPKDCLLR